MFIPWHPYSTTALTAGAPCGTGIPVASDTTCNCIGRPLLGRGQSVPAHRPVAPTGAAAQVLVVFVPVKVVTELERATFAA